MILILKTDIMDPVMQCTTLLSHSESLKRFLFHFSRRSTQLNFYRLFVPSSVDIEKRWQSLQLDLPNKNVALLESRAIEIHKKSHLGLKFQFSKCCLLQIYNNLVSLSPTLDPCVFASTSVCYSLVFTVEDGNSFLSQHQNKLLEEDKQIAEYQAAKDRYWKIPICYDDDDDEESSIPLKYIIISGLPPCVAITPVLLTEEPVDSLIMEDEHLDTIPATESDEVIKSSVENLGFSYSNDDSTSIDDDSFSIDAIDYVKASPPDSELVSLEEVKDFHTEDGNIEDDILHEKLSKINLLIAKIEAINSNPPLSSDFVTKSPSTFPNSFLDETNTFDNSIPESETFCFDLEENSSGSTTPLLMKCLLGNQ
ncbi:hypothetical protein Tco_0527384 [Tanacetum coccineum]